MDSQTTLLLMIIGMLSTLCQLFGWWLRIPSILFLLITGIVLGPLTGFFNPDELFGDLMFPIVSLAVSVILFEGSLTLKFNQINDQKRYFLRFIGLGGLITWLGISLAAHWVLTIDWSLSALIGAMLVVTGPTVIMPMLQAVRPHNNVAQLLKWEGIILDPLGALLAVLVFDFIASGQGQGLWFHSLAYFSQMFITGSLIGFISGCLLSELILSYLLPKFLMNIVVLNVVLAVFVLANHCYPETGLLAVTVMGLTIANRKDIDLTSILDFKETLSTLLISNLFIILAARLSFSSLGPVVIPSLVLFCLMQFVVRPFKVIATTMDSNLDFAHKILVSWIAPRGIIAAAIATLFEIKLGDMGYKHVEFITPLIFLIIVYSVLLPSLTAGVLAKALKVSDPEPSGILIVGANCLARAIATIFKKHGVSVVLADSSWDDISAARFDGLTTYYGNPVSEHADYNLNLLGIGSLLTITSNAELGVIAGLRFSSDFGKKNIYYLQTQQEQLSHDKYLVSRQHRGYQLFNEQITYEELSLLLQQGGELRSTVLSEQFDYDAYIKINTHHYIPLFAFDPKDKLFIFSTRRSVKPTTGWTIVSVHAMKVGAS
jgi:NhaP-type Na+/H+ or K+/H+ antiporter